MRVISKFRDYYDIHNTYDKEDTLFLRKTEIISFNLLNNHKLPEPHQDIYEIAKNIDYYFVIFCGKLYIYNTSSKFTGDKRKIIKNVFDENSSPYKLYDLFIRHNKQKIENILSTDYTDLCIEYNTPIITIHIKNESYWLEINPNLKCYSFDLIMNPWQANQEIDMFISNKLNRPKDPLPLSDESRRDAHGFDKYSFKKRKQP